MAAGERVLITGGGGFVGACLARDRITAGDEVHLILRPASRPWRLADLEGHYAVTWGDIRDALAMRRAVMAARPAVVYHLAAHGAYHFQKDRTSILATNLLGTANLLEALEGHDYRALVNVGSSSEYGHKSRAMSPADRLEPRTNYAVAKAAATLLCQAEAYRGRPVTTVRIFSAYGSWEDPSRLVPYVMGCCRRGESPAVTAGRQPRDFIFVDDVVDLLTAAAHDSRAWGQILHAGTGRQHSVRDMIEMILSVCAEGGPRAEYGTVEFRSGEPVSWVADIEQTQALTGWQPRYDLRAGVARTWDWYQKTPLPAAA